MAPTAPAKKKGTTLSTFTRCAQLLKFLSNKYKLESIRQRTRLIKEWQQRGIPLACLTGSQTP
jgi:hypothetical protein